MSIIYLIKFRLMLLKQKSSKNIEKTNKCNTKESQSIKIKHFVLKNILSISFLNLIITGL